MPFKYGKRDPIGKPSIPFKAFVDTRAITLPPHPPIDLLTGTLDSGWNMSYNDVAGTCAAADSANIIRILTSLFPSKTGYYYPTAAEVAALYRTQNPGWDPSNPSANDGGMDLQTLYEWMTKNVWGKHQLLGFAQVDHTNIDEMRAAISLFKTVSLGIQVQAHNQDEFVQKTPWTYDPKDVIEGGHAIASGGHWDSAAKDFVFVTWAEKTTLTQLFETNLLDECWILVYQEHIDNPPPGVDFATFAALYTQMTHRPFPAVVPPSPTPPGPLDGCYNIIAKAILGAPVKPITQARLERALKAGAATVISDLKKP